MANMSIPLADLQIGHFVELPLSWKDHPFIRSKFLIKDAQTLAVIKSLGLTEVPVNEVRSSVTIESTTAMVEPEPQNDIDAELETQQQQLEQQQQEQRLAQQKAARKAAEKALGAANEGYRDGVSQIKVNPHEVVSQWRAGLFELSDQVRRSEGIPQVVILSSNQANDDLFAHGVQCALLAFTCARALDWDKEDCDQVMLSALLHDIGKLRLPDHIRRRNVPLSKPEENYYKSHPLFSSDLLKELKDLSDAVKSSVSAHHERLDGSGFPKALTAKAIHRYAQLVAVVDQYDNLINPTHNAQALSPRQAIAYLLKAAAGKKFNADYVQALVGVLGLFPPGEWVVTQQEELARVVATNPQQRNQPYLLRYCETPLYQQQYCVADGDNSIADVLAFSDVNDNHRSYFHAQGRIMYGVVPQKNGN